MEQYGNGRRNLGGIVSYGLTLVGLSFLLACTGGNGSINNTPAGNASTNRDYIRDADTSQMNSGMKWAYVTLTYDKPFTADPDCLTNLVSRLYVVSQESLIQRDVEFKPVMLSQGELAGFSGWVIVPQSFSEKDYGSLKTDILDKGKSCRTEK